MEQLKEIDEKIYRCNLCSDMVEKFPNSKTVSIGKYSEIVILGEAPANNGWRKSGVAWYDVNHKLLPSGVVLQKLLDEIGLKIEDTYFLEAIKCYPKERKYLNKCSDNCKKYLFKQLDVIKPKIVLSLGDSATKTILDIKYKKFSDVVGKEFNINGFKVIQVYLFTCFRSGAYPSCRNYFNSTFSQFLSVRKFNGNYLGTIVDTDIRLWIGRQLYRVKGPIWFIINNRF